MATTFVWTRHFWAGGHYLSLVHVALALEAMTHGCWSLLPKLEALRFLQDPVQHTTGIKYDRVMDK